MSYDEDWDGKKKTLNTRKKGEGKARRLFDSKPQRYSMGGQSGLHLEKRSQQCLVKVDEESDS